MKPTLEQVIEFIIEQAADHEDGETGTAKCIELFCAELANAAKCASFIQGALEAGIPLSVIEGRTKLRDHFSASYINWKAGRKDGDK